MKYDTIVIGAGVSGLTAAILLAQNGRKVALLERSHVIAPTIRGFFRGSTYFDTGFHYAGLFGPGEPLTRLCERLGILSHIKIREDQRTIGDRFRCIDPELEFGYKVTLQSLMGQLVEHFPDEREAITRFLQNIKRFLDRINDDLFGLVMDPMSVFQDAHVSLSQYLQENFRSPILQTLLSLHSVLYGSMPEETSLLYHSIVVGPYYDRSYQVIDGGYAIARAFEKELQKYDIDVYTRCTVDHIFVDDDRAVKSIGIEGGDLLECENCVFTAHPWILTDLLPESSLRPAYRGRLRNLLNTPSAIVLYGVNETADRRGDSQNMILMRRLFPRMYDQKDGFADRPVFISRSFSQTYVGGVSIICPCCFEEVAQWETSKAGQRPPAYYEWKERAADTIGGIARQHYSDTLGDLRIIDAATPLTFRDYMNAPGGCLYGAKHRMTDMPFMPQTKIRGLYLSGQTIVSAGFMGAMLAGFLSASAITQENYRRTMQ